MFEERIDPALRDFDIEAVRSDHMSEPGRIWDQMYERSLNTTYASRS